MQNAAKGQPETNVVWLGVISVVGAPVVLISTMSIGLLVKFAETNQMVDSVVLGHDVLSVVHDTLTADEK